jgi:F0F1-type ATP synthase membrane subunit c/vacuolar-type H+-ATPase subunit K
MDPTLAEGKAVALALALTALAKSADASATVNRTLLKGLAMIESTACYWFVVSMVLIFTNPLWYAAPAAAAQAGAAPVDRGDRMTAVAGLSAPTVTLQDPLENAFAVFHQRRRIFQPQPVPREVATVASVSTGTARVQGLPGAGFGELLLFLGGLSGIPFNLDEGGIDVALLGDPPFARGSGRAARPVMNVAVGEDLLGRGINLPGQPLDGLGGVVTDDRWPIERPAAPIMDRASLTLSLQTGLKVIDAPIPIGRGQREPIFSDRQTRNTAIAIATIFNQRESQVLCVCCAVGQCAFAFARAVAKLREGGALACTVVVVVSEGNKALGLACIALCAAISIAEHVTEAGRDVLTVHDNLTHHARAPAMKSRCCCAACPPARSASVCGLHLLHPLAHAGAFFPPKCKARWRLCDRAAHHRNRAAEQRGLHSDLSDLDHQRADRAAALAV